MSTLERLRAALGDAYRAASEEDRLEVELLAQEAEGFTPATSALGAAQKRDIRSRMEYEGEHLEAAMGVVLEEWAKRKEDPAMAVIKGINREEAEDCERRQ